MNTSVSHNGATQKKPIAILAAQNDLWGLQGANEMVWELKKYGFEPVLVVSRTGLDRHGMVKSSVARLGPMRYLKETLAMDFMHWVDTLRIRDKKKPYDLRDPDHRLYTFKELGELCADGQVHYVNTGKNKVKVWDNAEQKEKEEKGGGKAIEDLIGHLERRGHDIAMLLSLDVMALLTPKTVSELGCFSTHPGYLTTRGLFAADRTRASREFTEQHGSNLHGSVFRMGPKLDDPDNLRYSVDMPCNPETPSFEAYDRLFTMLRAKVKEHLSDLIAEAALIKAGKAPLKQRPSVTARETAAGALEELEDHHVKHWLDKSEMHTTIEKDYFDKTLAKFLPRGKTLDGMDDQLKILMRLAFENVIEAENSHLGHSSIGDGGNGHGGRNRAVLLLRPSGVPGPLLGR